MDHSSIAWKKSSRCAANAQCVEVGRGRTVGVRDSKDQAGPVLMLSPGEWSGFIAAIKRGDYDSASA